MQELKKSLEEKLLTWNKYKQMVKEWCSNVELFRLYNFLIQASLFSEKGISMSELEKNMKKSKYIIKNLLDEISEDMLVIKKKSNFKFYSINLENLHARMFEESLEAIEKTN